MIRNFCYDIINSGPIQRIGREKRCGAVEDVDSSIYEKALKVNFVSMRTLCVRYSRKTRSPSHFLVVKNVFKI